MATVIATSFVQDIQNWAYEWSPVVMILFFSALIFMMWRMMKLMPRVKPQQIKPASDRAVGWKDIAGVDDARGELEEIVEFLRDPKQFEKLGAKVPKGILLHGPPGTGKTLLAKAVAHESGAQFFAQSAAAFVEMFAGLGAARIRRLFAIARKHEPAIIFIDELDAVGGRRGMDISGEKDQTLNQLLVEMDGFAGDSGRVGRDRRVEPARQARPRAAAPGALRPAGVRRPAGCQGARRRAGGAHAREAPGQGGPRDGRPADQRTDRRRPGEHLQRGGDLRDPARRERDRRRGLRLGAGARDRRRAVAARAERAREAGRRLPRGRARAVRGAACPRWIACTASRSSRADARSATP